MYRLFWNSLRLPISIPQRNISYVNSKRNVLELHGRGTFQKVFPEERTPDLLNKLQGSAQCFYCGFDPTSDSLHIGNLLTIMALLHCQRGGHQVLAVIGGGTAQIGDPSGKSHERPSITLNKLQENALGLEENLRRVFHNHDNHFWNLSKELKPIEILDNADWYSKINIVQFMASIGRQFRMGTMLRKDSVASRLQNPEGMSFTEFSYQVFQAYDWLHLFNSHKCLVQIGGNDQMGNILSGYELINRVHNKPVFGLTVPLITTTSGEKLGKTAGNAVWLNPEKTSPFELYQYFFNLADSDMEKYLKLFTFITVEDIENLMRQHWTKPDLRKAQKTLAEEVCRLVHGDEGVASAKRCTEVLFQNSAESLLSMEEPELKMLFKNAPTHELIFHPGTTVLEAVMKAKCFNREVDAERIINAGGVHFNNLKVTNANHVLIPGQHILLNNLTLLRTGKKTYHIIKWMT